MTLDADRVAGLARAKLRALVRLRFPEVTAEPEAFNAGVGIAQGNRAFVYLSERAPSPMAAVLAWGERRGASDLHVVVDEPDPLLELQAGGLSPRPTLWLARGAGLQPMPGAPRPPTVAEVPAAARAQVPMLVGAGCEPVIEHGVVIGEVLGLEVARVVLDEAGAATVRAGVGLYDQEAHALVHAETPVETRLAMVVAEVRRHRHRRARPHPLNRVARERWLRSVLLDDPGLVGLDELEAEAPLQPRGGIHEARPVAARGRAGDRRVLVVASTGIDLDLVPAAAAHAAADPPDEILLVLPARDHHRVVERMARHLAVPAELRAVADPWP